MGTHIIYYDMEDDSRDGNGWNIVDDGGAVALRYPTLQQARDWCEAHGEFYTILQRPAD